MTTALEFIKSKFIFIQTLSPREFKRYAFIGIGCLAVLLSIILYVVYTQSSALAAQLKKCEALGQKADGIVQQLTSLQRDEEKIIQMLDQHKDFNIKVYFENFIKEQGVNPSEGWNTSTPELLTAGLDKVTLTASFKGVNTQKIVTMLQSLRAQENVYVENWRIKKDQKSKQLTFDVVIATRRHRG